MRIFFISSLILLASMSVMSCTQDTPRDYIYSGDYRSALENLNEAIDRNPYNAKTLNLRGHIYRHLGEYDNAKKDFSEAAKLDPGLAEYTQLFIVITSWNASEADFNNSISELDGYINAHPSSEWVRTISEYYLGRITETDVLAKANEGERAGGINEKLCEAYYYLGEERLRKGDPEVAREFFEMSVGTNLVNFIEYDLSKMEIVKLSGEV